MFRTLVLANKDSEVKNFRKLLTASTRNHTQHRTVGSLVNKPPKDEVNLPRGGEYTSVPTRQIRLWI